MIFKVPLNSILIFTWAKLPVGAVDPVIFSIAATVRRRH